LKTYLKLVHMEIHRFRYILFALIGLTALFQIGTIVFYTIGKINDRNQYIEKFGKAPGGSFEEFSFTRAVANNQLGFSIPVALCVAVLVLYAFIIWYRDWFGRSSFAYRLLMLPSERRNVYFAKLTAILTFVFVMVGFQLLLMPIERWIYGLIVPAELLQPSLISDAIFTNRTFKVLIPRTFTEFTVSYGLGILALIITFTSILLERSYRMIGIFYGLVYAAVGVLLMIYPMIALGAQDYSPYLYPEEIYAVQMAIDALIVVVSVWLGLYLLKKKVSV